MYSFKLIGDPASRTAQMDNNSTNPNWPNNPTPTQPPMPTSPDPLSPPVAPPPATIIPPTDPLALAGQPPVPVVPPADQANPGASLWPNPTPAAQASSPVWPSNPMANMPPNPESNPFLSSAGMPTAPAAPSSWPALTPTPPPAPVEQSMPAAQPAAPATVPDFSAINQNLPPQDALAALNQSSASPMSGETYPPAPAPEAPTTIPSQDTTTTAPSWATNTVTNSTPGLSVDQTMPPAQASPTMSAEQVPTDLSHLISNSPSDMPAVNPAPETLIVPSGATAPDVASTPSEPHKGIPKWLIGIAAGLFIIVVGASAYFIMGLGQPSSKTTSLPATVAPDQTQQIKPTAPVPTPVTQTQPVAPTSTSSASFGDLQGSAVAPTTAPQATSAADILKQRQQTQ